MADVTISEVCRCKRISTSGRTDADFIWIRVSVWFLQLLNTVDFLKKVNKILSCLVLAIPALLGPCKYGPLQSITSENDPKEAIQ